MATPGPKIDNMFKVRIGWRMSFEHKTFYKLVSGYSEGEYVLEVLSNFSMFLGHNNSSGIIEEWNEEELSWERRIL